MINKAKVSVIIPVFNMARYVCDCLQSVCAQTLSPIEIICVDDGSTDNTKEVINTFIRNYNEQCKNAQKTPCTIKLLEQKNAGAGFARNTALAVASGEYVAFMDADDFYPDTTILQKLYTKACEQNVNVCGGSLVLSRFDGTFVQRYASLRENCSFFKEEMLYFDKYQICYGFTRFIYNLEFLKKHNLLFPKYSRYEDPIFLVQVLANAKSFYVIPDIVYAIRQSDKIIDYSSPKVMNDIANGFGDMMLVAKNKNYSILQKSLEEEIKKWKNRLALHFIAGNVELAKLLEKHFTLFNKTSELVEIVHDIKMQENSFKAFISNYDKIIIYGAGELGKNVYDYINDFDSKRFLGFAVTAQNGIKRNETARGIKVKDICEFEKYKKNALVIVATVSLQNASEMCNTLQQKGFENVYVQQTQIYNVNAFMQSVEKGLNMNNKFENRTNFAPLNNVSVNRNGGGNRHLAIFATQKIASKKFAFNARNARSSCTRRAV